MRYAYYEASVSDFLVTDDAQILGELTRAHGFALEHQQRDAWLQQITAMKRSVDGLVEGHILFEFAIPRIGKRADVVLVIAHAILVLEFKVGSSTFDRAAIEQVQDYALDLKNFHRGSHNETIVPILVATAAEIAPVEFDFAPDHVAVPIQASGLNLRSVIKRCVENGGLHPIDFNTWIAAGYQPTPTIVEAAQSLYQRHGVEEITRSDAGAQNLTRTANCIAAIIDEAKLKQKKAICLVTGVPGAGKTLAGLNIATRRDREHAEEHAVFLSGNGPLVEVLREALARDETAREAIRKKDAARKVASFIQNIHHFRDEALRDLKPPIERVVVFDEAQRAWTRAQAAKFMQTKRGLIDFDMSEPEFLIGVMDRHPDWSVIVCLVGGGQEINTGEAGLIEWLNALKSRFSHWDVHVSNRLGDSDYVSEKAASEALRGLNVTENEDLHLKVSMRSFRAEALSEFVSHIVENRPNEARQVYSKISARYPIWLTRNLDEARSWMRATSRGSERFGLLASSGAHRLRPIGLHVKAKIDAPTWFLNDRTDVRSSFSCEEVGTEFDVQGLELDWTGVCWDADLRYSNGAWTSHSFKGTAWQRVQAGEGQLYLKNAYRVLLTRARQGMIIFVPEGSIQDPTRPSAFYDQTFEFLMQCGLRRLAIGATCS